MPVAAKTGTAGYGQPPKAPAVFLSFLYIGNFSLCSCKHREVDKAYYYWRSGDASLTERKFLKQQEIKKLYVRIVDVDWNDVQGPIPVNPGSMESINYELKTYDNEDRN